MAKHYVVNIGLYSYAIRPEDIGPLFAISERARKCKGYPCRFDADDDKMVQAVELIEVLPAEEPEPAPPPPPAPPLEPTCQHGRPLHQDCYACSEGDGQDGTYKEKPIEF